jgi:UDP-2,3-diacylglucosamine hydrolase
MHGDALCTEDRRFQVFRQLIYNRLFHKLFMCIPYSVRKKIWLGARGKMRTSAQKRSAYEIDVYQPTIEKLVKKHRVSRLIHGHTHKQASYKFTVDGQEVERIVLGDWIQKDCVLVANPSGLKLLAVNDYIAQQSNATT